MELYVVIVLFIIVGLVSSFILSALFVSQTDLIYKSLCRLIVFIQSLLVFYILSTYAWMMVYFRDSSTKYFAGMILTAISISAIHFKAAAMEDDYVYRDRFI